MIKMALLILSLFLFPAISFADIQLTDEQFENLDVLTVQMKKKDANFLGFNGSKQNMKIVGNVSEDDVKKELSKIDITAKKKERDDNDPMNQKRKSGTAKLKASIQGITTDELRAMGLKVEE